MSRYKFNKEQLRFVEEGSGMWTKVTVVLKYLSVSLFLAVLYYFVFSSLFNTREQERLSRENRLMNEEYERALERLDLLDNVVADLQTKDREIYMNIFKSNPPDFIYDYNSRLYASMDTASDKSLVSFTSDKIDNSIKMAGIQSDKINRIYREIAGNDSLLYIPSEVPVRNFSVSQTGAGMGEKIHPFYKTKNFHSGMDLLAVTGTEVLAAASGTVSEVTRSDRGRGNQVRIDHGNGYVTYYAHLGEIMVGRGRRVTKGDPIARVGNSGLSFAPHLHYEVLLDDKVQDPTGYFFGELSPSVYREMTVTALNSGQSLD
jgi:murein DD-endopeptidase MepM/ murein hydrolase activator NlpD